MNSKISFLLARAGVVTAIVCALLASLRYSLTEIFVGGFGYGDELIDRIDGRFILFTAGGSALAIGLVELARYLAVKSFRPTSPWAENYPVPTFARDGIRPKFGV